MSSLARDGEADLPFEIEMLLAADAQRARNFCGLRQAPLRNRPL